MTIERATLYVCAYDLCRQIDERCRGQNAGERLHSAECLELARRLTTRCAQALTFPQRRDALLVEADELVVALRVTLRFARDGRELTTGFARLAHAELSRVGRMIGGWRRQRRSRTFRGGRLETAAGASSAAAPTGTKRGTAVPPTGTGTDPRTPTTTTASASPSPPPSPRDPGRSKGRAR